VHCIKNRKLEEDGDRLLEEVEEVEEIQADDEDRLLEDGDSDFELEEPVFV